MSFDKSRPDMGKLPVCGRAEFVDKGTLIKLEKPGHSETLKAAFASLLKMMCKVGQ